MKKLGLFILSVLMLVGCSSNTIKVNQVNNGFEYTRIDRIPDTIGVAIGVEECESETGYCVKYGFDEDEKIPNVDRTKYNVVVQRKEYFIHVVNTEHKENDKTLIKSDYYYNDYTNDKLVYSEISDLFDEQPLYSNIKYNYISKNDYFYFKINNEIVIYEVSSGEFKEVERISYVDNDYTFDSMKVYKDTYVLIYKSKDKVRTIYNGQVLETNISDKVVFLEEGFFVSEYQTGNLDALKSYYVDLENNKTECNQPISINIILVEDKDGFVYTYNGNCWYAQINDNQINTYDLGIKYTGDKFLTYGIKNDKDIIFMIQDGSEINIELYKIK